LFPLPDKSVQVDVPLEAKLPASKCNCKLLPVTIPKSEVDPTLKVPDELN